MEAILVNISFEDDCEDWFLIQSVINRFTRETTERVNTLALFLRLSFHKVKNTFQFHSLFPFLELY